MVCRLYDPPILPTLSQRSPGLPSGSISQSSAWTASRLTGASSSTGTMSALRTAAPAGPERTVMPSSIRQRTPGTWPRSRRCSAGRATPVSTPTPIHWAGDQQSQSSELASALRAGLSAALTGIPFWGFDIGGFAGPLPTLDLYRRATQLACFVPVMQWHSEPDGGQFRELMPRRRGEQRAEPMESGRGLRCAGVCGRDAVLAQPADESSALSVQHSVGLCGGLHTHDAAAGLSMAGRSAGMGL